MSAPRTRRRWLELLRRTAGISEPTGAMDDAHLWEARERAAKATQEAEKLGERVVATTARQRTNIEAALERANNVLSRRDALSNRLKHVEDALERLGVVGLNAGLEGARTTEPLGRGLTLVAEEVRGHVSRGSDAAGDLGGHIHELLEVAGDLAQRIERVQRDAQELATDATQLKVCVQASQAGLQDLESRLRKATGLDPETAKYIALVGDHAKGLLGALSALEASGSRQAAVALVPLLAPVMKVLSGIISEEAESGGSGSSA
ncbi:MAG: hypothetical protein HOW73_36000 [Polyangiaceae bacterium]|nr:hypothetical protein [Polyangiaceae bacterium]